MSSLPPRSSSLFVFPTESTQRYITRGQDVLPTAQPCFSLSYLYVRREGKRTKRSGPESTAVVSAQAPDLHMESDTEGQKGPGEDQRSQYILWLKAALTLIRRYEREAGRAFWLSSGWATLEEQVSEQQVLLHEVFWPFKTKPHFTL